jgi:nickel/cobalt exporter
MAVWTMMRLREEEAHHHRHHGHGHAHSHDDEEFEDAHARAHAEDIRRRFAGRDVTTGQIVLFGITGGLMPCPAAVSILLICLQLKEFTLGFAMVASFSAGLALTMITVGVLAAWGMKKLSERSSWLSRSARKAPYVSSALLIVLGLLFVWQGWSKL